MAGENDKTFSEEDMNLLLADRVAKETAEITSERDALKAERDELQGKLDVAETAKATAEQDATKVREEFDTFKADLESLRESAERKDERLEKVKEAASHMGEDFFSDEKRIERIVAMSDENFADYVDALKDAAPVTGAPPRETAMNGSSATTKTPAGNSARALLLGRYTTKEG